MSCSVHISFRLVASWNGVEEQFSQRLLEKENGFQTKKGKLF